MPTTWPARRRCAGCRRSSRSSSRPSWSGATGSSSWVAATAETHLVLRRLRPRGGRGQCVSRGDRGLPAAGRLARRGGHVRRVAGGCPRILVERVKGDNGPRVVYARFFLHAITEREEESLLDLAAAICEPDDLLAVEYRTIRDLSGTEGDRLPLPAVRPAGVVRGACARPWLRRALHGRGVRNPRSTGRTTPTWRALSSGGEPSRSVVRRRPWRHPWAPILAPGRAHISTRCCRF